MKIKKDKQIRVGNHIKPIHFKLRKEPELIIGNNYYISFGMNQATACILLNIIGTGEGIPKQVQIGINDNSQLGYGDISVVYSDEIGIRPEAGGSNPKTS